MMYEGNNESWSIFTSKDDLLNFVIFTGCMYNLIDGKNFDEENERWPTNILISKLDDLHLEKLKIQWSEWFNNVINEKISNANLDEMCSFIEEKYDVNNFSQLKYVELRECCKNAYPHFVDWWNMQAGGRVALSFYEFIGNNKISEYISELECKLNKKSKPFKLYLDMVYTGVPKVLDINDEYIIVTPNGYLDLSREWWINKLSKLI